MSADVWLGAPEAERYFEPNALSEADRQRYAGLRAPRARQEFAVSRALKASAQLHARGPTSLSHSGGWAAVAVGPQDCRLGVDIEFHRPRDLLGIARFAFDPTESRALEGADTVQRSRLFYALWTMKEAMAKALALPLLVATRQCVFAPDAAGWRGTAPTVECWEARVFQPRPALTLSLVILGSGVSGSVITYEGPPTTPVSWESIATVSSALES